MKKFILVISAIIIIASLLAGCSSSPSTSTATPGTSTTTTTTPVTTIVVGTGNDMQKFCYLDANGNLVGFEIDLLTAVDKLLPQYQFKFEVADFASILVGLGTQKYDIAAHYYAWNPTRAQSYLYAGVPYLHYSYKITVVKGRTDIQSLSDLEGKTVYVASGSNTANYFETYNKTAKKQINLSYGSLTPDLLVKGLADRQFDATFLDTRTINDYNVAYGNQIAGVGDDLLPGYTYYLFQQGNVQLKDAVDGALNQLRADGTITALSTKWLGADYSQLIPGLEIH
jgi:L-cystine transport system substrate-binding protein